MTIINLCDTDEIEANIKFKFAYMIIRFAKIERTYLPLEELLYLFLIYIERVNDVLNL